MNDDLGAARPDAAPAAGAPGPARDASDDPGTVRLARHVVETELENVLQSLFSVRQDLSELAGDRPDRRRLQSAMGTMQELIAAVRVLLAVLRAFGSPGAGETGLFDRTARGFAVLRPDGEVLYMNAEVTRVVGRDHHVVAATPFAERSWADREQMRRHLEVAYARGRADDAFDVVRGDGRTIVMRLHTERLDADGDAVLLMTHVEG